MTGLDVKWLSIEINSIELASQTWSDAMRTSYQAAMQSMPQGTSKPLKNKEEFKDAAKVKAA